MARMQLLVVLAMLAPVAAILPTGKMQALMTECAEICLALEEQERTPCLQRCQEEAPKMPSPRKLHPSLMRGTMKKAMSAKLRHILPRSLKKLLKQPLPPDVQEMLDLPLSSVLRRPLAITLSNPKARASDVFRMPLGKLLPQPFINALPAALPKKAEQHLYRPLKFELLSYLRAHSPELKRRLRRQPIVLGAKKREKLVEHLMDKIPNNLYDVLKPAIVDALSHSMEEPDWHKVEPLKEEEGIDSLSALSFSQNRLRKCVRRCLLSDGKKRELCIDSCKQDYKDAVRTHVRREEASHLVSHMAPIAFGNSTS